MGFANELRELNLEGSGRVCDKDIELTINLILEKIMDIQTLASIEQQTQQQT